MSIETVQVRVNTVGEAGAAEGSAQTPAMNGYLLDVYLDFDAAAPATTDTTISFTDRGGNVLAVTDSSTDALIAPRQKLVDNTNTAITDSHDRFPLSGPLTVEVAGCDQLEDAVVVTIRYERK